MKTKSLLIVLSAAIFILTFSSCSKQIINARIKAVEMQVSHLEKNYRDMTRAEFNEAFDEYMTELKELSNEDLTKEQKEKIFSLKIRLGEVKIRYNIPFTNNPFTKPSEDDRLSSRDSAASLSKINLSADGSPAA